MMEKLELRLRLFFIAEIVVLIGVIGFFLTIFYALGKGHVMNFIRITAL